MRRRLLAGWTVAVLLVASSALAQTGLTIDGPSVGATTNLTTIDGWAIDGAGTGTGIDAVHVWFFPLPVGVAEWIGAATLGHSRPDVAAHFGQTRFTPSGFTLVPTVPLHAGDGRLCAYARSTATGTFSQVSCKTITIYQKDPYWPDLNPVSPLAAGMKAFLDRVTARYDAGTQTLWLDAHGWGVSNGAMFPPNVVASNMLIDDWLENGYAYTMASYRPDVCPVINTIPGWICQGVKPTSPLSPPSDATNVGLWGIGLNANNVGPGWHYVRIWIWDAPVWDVNNPYQPTPVGSNAVWFYKQ